MAGRVDKMNGGRGALDEGPCDVRDELAPDAGLGFVGAAGLGDVVDTAHIEQDAFRRELGIDEEEVGRLACRGGGANDSPGSSAEGSPYAARRVDPLDVLGRRDDAALGEGFGKGGGSAVGSAVDAPGQGEGEGARGGEGEEDVPAAVLERCC
ncbi:MAG: hypothetical protein L6Q76_01015 [Polyangiaceae bacterium]|nr:hypothetical protein [Polyangiaceae bacterium]